VTKRESKKDIIR